MLKKIPSTRLFLVLTCFLIKISCNLKTTTNYQARV
jgi:hypothetical protein